MTLPERASPEVDGGRRLVIGVGNVFRCDDAVGIVIARRFREKCVDVCVAEASGEGASLMAIWRADDDVVIVDAVRSGAKPGVIHRLDAHAEPIPSAFFNYSTHAFSVAEAIEMARALETLPRTLVVYGVEGARFEAGDAMSDAVAGAVDEVVGRVAAELQLVGA